MDINAGILLLASRRFSAMGIGSRVIAAILVSMPYATAHHPRETDLCLGTTGLDNGVHFSL